MSDFISVYIVAGSHDEAGAIAAALIDEKLAACVNILPDLHSIYRWRGKVERADETALIAKTTADKFEAVQKRVKELHSYGCPCVVAWPIVAGNEDYLAWIRDSLK